MDLTLFFMPILLQSTKRSSSLSISDKFSRALKHAKNLFGSNSNESNERGYYDQADRGFDFSSFKKQSDRACQKLSGASEKERKDFFLIGCIDRKTCGAICYYSSNCSGWEYESIGRRCAIIWHASSIDERLVEIADSSPGIDCYIKYYHGNNSRDDKSGPKRKKKNERNKELDRNGSKKNHASGIRSKKRNDTVDIKSNIHINFFDKDDDDRDATHPCQTPCSDCNGDRSYSSDYSRGNYLFGSDCSNDRGGCAPGLLCRPSALNGSDRWTCQ